MINKTNLTEHLIKDFPELKEEYHKIITWYGKDFPGNHNIFCDVFNPFIIDLLDSDRKENLLKRAMSFLNKMAESEDDEVVNVLEVTILERIGDSPKWLKIAREYMSPKVLNLSEEIERYLGRCDD